MHPRALWVASHHAELQGKLPGNWGNLLDGIDQLLVNSINDDSYAKVRPSRRAIYQKHVSVLLMVSASCCNSTSSGTGTLALICPEALVPLPFLFATKEAWNCCEPD